MEELILRMDLEFRFPGLPKIIARDLMIAAYGVFSLAAEDGRFIYSDREACMMVMEKLLVKINELNFDLQE